MPLIPNPIDPKTQQDFLDLMDRLLPYGYITPLKQGDGYEIVQAFAAMLARLSTAVANTGKDAQIATAGDGSRATATIELYRNALPATGQALAGQTGSAASIVPGAGVGQMRVSGLANMSAASVGHHLVLSNTSSPGNTGGFPISAYVSPTVVDVTNSGAAVPDANNGFIAWTEENRAVTVKAGTVVTTGATSRDYTTDVDVLFSPTDLGPKAVTVTAISHGYEWNQPGPVTTADGTVLPGEIDTIRTLVEDPPLLDIGIQVRQTVAASGGVDASLESLGADRGIERGSGEQLERYRNRVRALPDTVSINAFARTIIDMLAPYGLGYELIEAYDIAFQTMWDGLAYTPAGSAYNPNLFAYDLPDEGPFRARWLDINNMWGGVIVVVEASQPIEDHGMAWDDPAVITDDLRSPLTGGSRAVSAFDVPDSFVGWTLGCWDGQDNARISLYDGICDTLQAIKPAGASVAVVVRGV